MYFPVGGTLIQTNLECAVCPFASVWFVRRTKKRGLMAMYVVEEKKRREGKGWSLVLYCSPCEFICYVGESRRWSSKLNLTKAEWGRGGGSTYIPEIHSTYVLHHLTTISSYEKVQYFILFPWPAQTCIGNHVHVLSSSVANAAALRGAKWGRRQRTGS